jgi:ADP-heptose:LPS heptosyltransferase
VIKLFVYPITMHDVVCRTTLPQLLEVIRNAELLITNDSAPVHLAAAASTPSICILGGGHFGRFLPYATENEPTSPTPVIATYEMDCYNCRWHCKFDIADGQATPCIANIAVLNVYEACCNLLTQG